MNNEAPQKLQRDGMEREARELAKLLEPHLGDAEWYTEGSAIETIVDWLAEALAKCANEARLDEQCNHNMVTAKAWRERIAELKAAAEPVSPPKPAREGG